MTDLANRARLVGAFSRLTEPERELITCALAGTHPRRLHAQRLPVLAALAHVSGNGSRRSAAAATELARSASP